MSQATVRASVFSEATLLPASLVIVALTAFAGMAKWVGAIDVRQEHDRQMTALLVDQLKALTESTMRANEDAAATRAQIQMIVRELDQEPRRRK